MKARELADKKFGTKDLNDISEFNISLESAIGLMEEYAGQVAHHSSQRYFLRNDYAYQDKNKAEAASAKYLSQYANMLVPDNESLDKVIEQIKNKVEEINQEHRRCKDFEVSIVRWDNKVQGIHLPSAGLSVLEVKGDLEV